MVLFILQFIIYSGLLYLAYRLLFSQMSFFKLNRGILLAIPAISILIPLVAPQFEAPRITQPAISAVLQEVNLGGDIIATQAQHAGSPNFSWWWLAYGFGAATVLAYVLIGFVKGLNILRHSTHAFENIHFSEFTSGPFAFFKRIVIPSQLLHSEKLATVVAHEKAHVEQHHGFDNLYYNLLSAVFWFNPFIHLLNRELRQSHECLADEAALESTPKEIYAHLLLSSTFGSELSFDSANRFFNSSLIKTRITMMYKAKTNTKMKGLYLALLPLMAVMVLLSCQKKEDSEAGPDKKKLETMDLAEVDSPPLFDNCDANATTDEQMQCFQMGIMRHVQENFKYPKKAQEQNMEGKLYVNFTITKSGEVVNTKVMRGLTAEGPEQEEAARLADQIAIELVESIPPMSPAIKDGKKVAITFTLPINMKMG